MNNKLETILFAGIIGVIILPLMIISYAQTDVEEAEKYEPVDVSEAIRQITPYVMIDETGLVKFIVEEKNIPLHLHTIQIASDYIQMQNSVSSQAQENPDEKPKVDEKIFKKFSKLEKDIKKNKNKSINSIDVSIGLEWILPEAFALWGDVCGGQSINPHPAPTIYTYYRSQGAVAWLGSNGYTLVPSYASNNYGSDYGKNVSAYGCGNGEMRSQAVATSYNYHTSQSPEPNPDINAYTAPVWWWDGYVYLWHVASP